MAYSGRRRSGIRLTHTQQRSNSATLRAKPASGRTGYCYAFNAASGCHYHECRYANSCSKCQRTGHGAYRCRVGGPTRWASTSTASAATPVHAKPQRALPAPATAMPATNKSEVANRSPANTSKATLSGLGGPSRMSSFRPPNTN